MLVQTGRLRFCIGLLLFTSIVASLGLPYYNAAAQDTKTVAYDTPVEGQITDAQFEELWTLKTPAKDVISITAERTGGTLAPRIEFRDPNGQRMAGAEVDYTYAKAVVRDFALPASGTYTVAISRYALKDGKTSGNYKLTVSLLGSGEDNPNLKVQAKPIEYDKPANGEITNARWREGWTFAATGKDNISVSVKRLDGTLWPEILLLDSSGNTVTQASSSRDGVSATIDHFKLPNPGQYTVLVRRYNSQNGRTVGKYLLMVTLNGAGEDRPEMLTKPQGAVKIDDTVSGSLTTSKWADVWTMDAQSKDHLLITATRTDGNLIPEVILLGANNQEVQRARANDSYASTQMDVTLPGPGKYAVMVRRQDGGDAYSLGNYELTVTVLGTGDDNPSFKTSAGEVKLNTPTNGTLTNAKWQDSYAVNFQGKDPVTITVKRTSGTLIPAIRVLGANQQEIYGVRSDETYAQAVIKDFTIPGPGQYTIIVTRVDNMNGLTSGGYELTVTQGKTQQ